MWMPNKAVGFRLVTKAGTTGLVNLTKAVPVVGGFVGGTFDYVAVCAVGRYADRNLPLALLYDEGAGQLPHNSQAHLVAATSGIHRGSRGVGARRQCKRLRVRSADEGGRF